MARLSLILILIVALAAVGCNKKQEEIDALQQDAAGENAEAVMDSLDETAGEEAIPEETGEDQPAPARTEVKAPPSKPEPDYSGMEGFVIQLGSYKDYELANYWAEKYQNREYPAFLRQVELNGETYYRLRVGVYDTYEEALEAGKMLADRYSATYWIDNNR